MNSSLKTQSLQGSRFQGTHSKNGLKQLKVSDFKSTYISRVCSAHRCYLLFSQKFKNRDIQ